MGATPQALALERATLTQAAAQANYDALVKGATTPELEQARAGVDQAQAGIIQASAAVSQTEAALTSASAGLRAEEARLDLMRAGARPEQVKVAEAQVAAAHAQAEAASGQVAAARAGLDVIDEQLARMTIHAPADGVVLSRAIEPGEVALPGGALLVLGDLEHLTVTVYVPEDRYGTIRDRPACPGDGGFLPRPRLRRHRPAHRRPRRVYPAQRPNPRRAASRGLCGQGGRR